MDTALTPRRLDSEINNATHRRMDTELETITPRRLDTERNLLDAEDHEDREDQT